jgi:5'-nucleotidase
MRKDNEQHRQDEAPLILVTNDDGIVSRGLWAAAEAAQALGDVVVVAPSRQWSGAARSMPAGFTGAVEAYEAELDEPVPAYQVDTSPALAVLHALFEIVDRTPSLVISGINYGENLGTDVTVSGTVGAAIQAAVSGIPSLAASLQTPVGAHRDATMPVDFGAAIHYIRVFGRFMLDHDLPFDVDVLKLDVPAAATSETPWRLARISRMSYFVPTPPVLTDDDGKRVIPYDARKNPERSEPDSDIRALAVEGIVTVAPLSVDLTSRVALPQVEEVLARAGLMP